MDDRTFGDGVPMPSALRSSDPFGDGVPLPASSIKPHDTGVPRLEDVYERAVIARAAGQDFVFVEASGYGRAWAPYVVAFGVRGLVVQRYREPVSKAGKPLDSGPIARLLVRFAVIDVMVAWKREYLRRINTDSTRLRVNRRRRVRRNVTIR